MIDGPCKRGRIAVDDDLIRLILKTSKLEVSHVGHNIGGWRSAPEVRWLAGAAAAISEVIAARPGHVEAWAVVHQNGSYHSWHSHRGTPWLCSGICYLTTGGAATLFRSGGELVRVPPVAGDVYTFGPAIEHCSEAHYGPPRVTLAYNVRR